MHYLDGTDILGASPETEVVTIKKSHLIAGGVLGGIALLTTGVLAYFRGKRSGSSDFPMLLARVETADGVDQSLVGLGDDRFLVSKGRDGDLKVFDSDDQGQIQSLTELTSAGSVQDAMLALPRLKRSGAIKKARKSRNTSRPRKSPLSDALAKLPKK